jgi:hypothetical protein
MIAASSGRFRIRVVVVDLVGCMWVIPQMVHDNEKGRGLIS